MRTVAFTKYDVALFVEDTGKTRWSQLLKEFVENGSANHISRQRLSSYLKELVAEGLVTKTIDPTALMLRMAWRVYPVYTVPASRKKRLQDIRAKKRILEYIDTATPDELRRLHQHIAEQLDPPVHEGVTTTSVRVTASKPPASTTSCLKRNLKGGRGCRGTS